MGERLNDFSLEREHRVRLLSGDYRPLLCQTKPAGCEPGARYVITWFRQQRGRAEDVTYEVPASPSCFITVSTVKRHIKGGWLIRYEVTDLRSPVRFLRASPPVWVPQGEDSLTDSPTTSEESFYTTSRWGSIDNLEVVPREWQQQHSKASSQEWHEVRVQRVEVEQRERLAAKRRRKRQRRIERAAAGDG